MSGDCYFLPEPKNFRWSQIRRPKRITKPTHFNTSLSDSFMQATVSGTGMFGERDMLGVVNTNKSLWDCGWYCCI